MLSKRLLRAVTMQGRGSNYRKLSKEEKLEAERNFYQQLQQSKSPFSKLRNPLSVFKSLAYQLDPPVAETKDTEINIQGDRFIDEYSWMQDDNNYQDWENYIKDETLYTEAFTAKDFYTASDLIREFRERTPQTIFQVVEQKGYQYTFENNCLVRKFGDTIEVVLSYEEMKNHPILKFNQKFQRMLKEISFPIVNTQFSHDHRMIAFSIQVEEKVGIIVKDMANKAMTGFFVDGVDEFCIFDKLYGLYYIEKDKDTGKGKKCFRADLNPELSKEEQILREAQLKIGKTFLVKSELVYEEKDPSFNVEVTDTLSGEYILVKTGNMSNDLRIISNEIRFRPSNRGDLEFLIIQERKEGVFYEVRHQGEDFFILVTTLEEPNRKVLKVSIPPYHSYNPPKESLLISESKELIGTFMGAKTHIEHRNNISIDYLETYKEHSVQVLTDTETSLQYIEAQNLLSGTTDIVAYDTYEGQLKIANNKSYRIHVMPEKQDYLSHYFNYKLSTLHSPNKIIKYNLNSKINELIDLEQHINNVRLEDYSSERIVLPATDNQTIPITLIYNKKYAKSGLDTNVILHTFGGETKNTHNFMLDYMWLSMLDRGYLWAIPHIRGSYDINYSWYQKGIHINKIRHIQDFLDIAVSMVSEKIAGKLHAYGEGNSGGLTVASAIMKEPKIFTSAVLRNPILDVISYLTNKRDMSEFGSLDDPDIYKIIKKYSPYHAKIEKQNMTQMMIAADFDNESAYHATKFVAKLRKRNVGENNILIYKEYPTWTTDDVKRAEEFSFIISSNKRK